MRPLVFHPNIAAQHDDRELYRWRVAGATAQFDSIVVVVNLNVAVSAERDAAQRKLGAARDVQFDVAAQSNDNEMVQLQL